MRRSARATSIAQDLSSEGKPRLKDGSKIMTAKPRISVIIAAYNCGDYLPAALESLLAQTLRPYEIIVVDDGSTDNTREVTEHYNRDVVYIHQSNKGEAAARNRALDIVSGDYVAIQDADDISSADRIRRQVEALGQSPSAVACFTGHWVFGEEGTIAEYPGNPAACEMDSLAHLSRCAAFGPTMLLDRHKVGNLRYPPEVGLGTDMVFVSMLRTRGPFVIVPDSLYGYRRRSGQLTGRFTFLEGFENRMRWLKENRKRYWRDRTIAETEHVMWQGLVETLVAFYWARDRQKFMTAREYLKRHWPGPLPLPREVNWRWYPEWVWRATEWRDRLRLKFNY
jgi:glycosyltransferase involved in cell wall biosynthesis